MREGESDEKVNQVATLCPLRGKEWWQNKSCLSFLGTRFMRAAQIATIPQRVVAKRYSKMLYASTSEAVLDLPLTARALFLLDIHGACHTLIATRLHRNVWILHARRIPPLTVHIPNRLAR